MLIFKYNQLMRRLITSFTLVLGMILVAFVSCSDDIEIVKSDVSDILEEENCITLTLNCSQAVTRDADNPIEEGIINYNENKIESVTIFLSPLAGDATDDKKVLYRQTFNFSTPIPQNSVTVRIPLQQDLINTLFRQSNDFKCRAYAAVNVDATSAQTIEDLQKLVISSEFETRQIQPSFAMFGDSEVSYKEDNRSAKGIIEVNRSASKIELSLNVDNEIVEETAEGKITWTPNLKGMTVRLQNGLSTSTLEPGNLELKDEYFFNTPYNLKYGFVEKEGEQYDRAQEIPFYTYPHGWSDSENEKHASFLILSVPWSPDDGKSWKTCYYHVPILPTDKFEIIRNHSYHIRLHVGMLGSFVPEVPMVVSGDYTIVPWGETQEMEVNINDYRYLVVNQNVYTVNNETEISIPFYTSHETVVTDVKMTFYRYNFSDQGSEFAVVVDSLKNKESFEKTGKRVFDAWFNNDDDNLIVKHDLKIFDPYNSSGNKVSLTTNLNGTRSKLDNQTAIDAVLNTISYFQINNGENNDEYSRIEYEITVQHKDVYEGNHISPNLFKETITIYQYPGMYITAVQNYAAQLGQGRDPNNPSDYGSYYWTSGAKGSAMISGRYTPGTNYPMTDARTNFWETSHLTLKQTLSSSTDKNTAIRDGLIFTDNSQTNIVNYFNNWPQTSKNQFFLGYNTYNWNYSLGLDADYGNWNPNMYLVTVTQLPQNTNYIIDDPRSYYVNNFLNDIDVNYQNLNVWNGDFYYFNKKTGAGPESATTSFGAGATNPMNQQVSDNDWSRRYWLEFAVEGFITAPSIEGGNRKLQYYYPTREDASAKNIIAPKFRICSSYAGTSAYLTRSMSRRRAAAYQEMGYYAGRWRLPTEAEVRFMIDLAAQEKIPRLFGSTGDSRWNYWCAQGAMSVPGKTEANQNVYIDAYPVNGGSNPASGGLQPDYLKKDLFTGNNYRDHTRFVYDEWYWGSTTLDPSGPVTNTTTTPVYTFTWGDRLKSNPEEN